MLPRPAGRRRGEARTRGRPPHRERNRRRSASAQKPAGSYPREDAPGGSSRTEPPHAAGDPHPGVKDLLHRSRRQVDHGTRRRRARRLETGAASSSGAARRVPAFFLFRKEPQCMRSANMDRRRPRSPGRSRSGFASAKPGRLFASAAPSLRRHCKDKPHSERTADASARRCAATAAPGLSPLLAHNGNAIRDVGGRNVGEAQPHPGAASHRGRAARAAGRRGRLRAPSVP